MIWYGLENGQLRTLRKMLEAPLEFDPVDFIERTFQDPGNKPAEETLEIALSYNLLKTQLITSLNKIHYCLSNTAKLNFENLGDDSTPLGYELLMRPQSASIKEALRMRVCDGTNLYLDRLLDSFKIKDCRGSKPNSQLHDVIKLYFLSEVLFFLLTNTATAVREGDSIFIAPASPEIVKQFHRKWFANRWEQNSCIANIAYLDILPKGANNNSYFFDAIAMFGEKLVDKIFFLPVDKLPGRLERSPYIQWIKKLCTLAILCMWCKTKNDMEYAPRDWINKIGISNDDVEKIKYYSSSQSEPDQVFDVGNNGISIGNPSITIQLRHTLDFIARNVTDSTFNNMVGDFFEKTCIIGYFEDDEIRKNYSAFTGFVPGDVRDESLKPDIDLIIKDIHRNKYYFAQVKYMRIGGKAYISGDIDHLISGALHKGMRQLVDAKTALQDGKLKHILLEKGLHDCTPENSYFLLIPEFIE